MDQDATRHVIVSTVGHVTVSQEPARVCLVTMVIHVIKVSQNNVQLYFILNQSSTGVECSSDLLTNDITCSACQVGYFGEGCTQQCVCSNNADCDHISGECRCKSGWRGHFCDKGKIINSIDSLV